MKMLVLGDPIIDEYLLGHINRMSPEDSSIPVFDIEKKEYRLGGCLNTAANLKSIDPENDIYVRAPVSTFTWNMLNKIGVHSLVLLSEDFENGDNYLEFPQHEELVKTRVIDIDKNNKQLIRLDNKLKFDEATSYFFKKWLLQTTKLNDYDCIVVSDYEKGCIDQNVIDFISSFDGPVFIDTKKKDLSIWKNIKRYIIKINSQEYSLAANSHSIKNLVVTRGKHGAVWFENGSQIYMCETFEIPEPNIIGAGDCFLSGFVLKYMETESMEESLKFATRVASVSVKKFGTSVVEKNELI
jgi:rfaE bifunctional protein kinase chain/domain